MRNKEAFDNFYDTLLLKAEKFDFVEQPCLPRNKKAPKKIEVGSGSSWYPETPRVFYRRIYFEALDLIISAISHRFDQPSFQTCLNLENVILKTIRSEDVEQELAFVDKNYKDEVDITLLKSQLQTFKVLMRVSGKNISCFHDIYAAICKLSDSEKQLLKQVLVICKLIAVNPCSSASAERTFSSARRLKTWLRSTMTQLRFNNIAILQIHKNRTDQLRLVDVGNEFVNNVSNRKAKFGVFTDSDFNRIF